MRVLLVEDSAPTRDLLERALGEGGIELVTAARLATGRRLALGQAFDVIVLDLMLPDGDGLALCAELRAQGITTPILCLTARGDVSDRILGLDTGADDYLRKPFALAELLARLRALARRQGLAPPTRVTAGEIVLDFTARRLTHATREVVLTAREWEVLESLAARPGRVVGRAELLERIWQQTSDAASASLDVILSRLRRKLGGPGGPLSIRTVRGEGYVFERVP